MIAKGGSTHLEFALIKRIAIIMAQLETDKKVLSFHRLRSTGSTQPIIQTGAGKYRPLCTYFFIKLNPFSPQNIAFFTNKLAKLFIKNACIFWIFLRFPLKQGIPPA